jgi:cation diffusion facilitator CzcD-associated flavoprotein CzcO
MMFNPSANLEPCPPSDTVIPIVIIGAGISGIAAGCQLKQQLGIDKFQIFDRLDGIGVFTHAVFHLHSQVANRLKGTWRVNRYPGVACDM